MTTEKEFWEFTSRYFRTVVSIQNIIDELKVSGGLSKDVRAIKAMKGVENVMKEFNEQNQKQSSIDEGCVGCAGPCSDRVKERLKAEEGEVARLRFIIAREHGEAANLQKELDSTIGQLIDSRKRCDHLSTELESREAELFDLKNAIPDNFWAVVTEKDSMIRRQGKVIEDFKTIKGQTEPTIDEGCVGCCRVQCDTELIERLSTEIHNRDKTIKDFKAIETKETDRLHEIIEESNDENLSLRVTINDMAKKHVWYKTTIEELKDENIEDLHELYDLYEKELGQLKHVISARDLTIKSLTTMCQSSGTERNKLTSTIEDQKRTIDHFINCIGGLEAELSARKEDSAVLMKVVDIVKNDKQTCCHTLNMISVLLTDYLDAREGPPETPIDDLYRTTVSIFLEMP